MRGDPHTGALEHRPPVDELGVARLAEPRPPLRLVGLQLEEVAAERAFEPCERSLGAVGCPPESRLTPARRRGLRLAARPTLEQAAEGERARFAGAELPDQPPRGLLLGSVVLEHVCPAWLVRAQFHTSTTTGRIIGRRPVRS